MSNELTIPIARIPTYLWEKHRLRITRQTVYNWMNIGLRGTKLVFTVRPGRQTTSNPGLRTITKANLHEFIQRSGIQLPHVDSVEDRPSPIEDDDKGEDAGPME